jgi:hypothetical protein
VRITVSRLFASRPSRSRNLCRSIRAAYPCTRGTSRQPRDTQTTRKRRECPSERPPQAARATRRARAEAMRTRGPRR